MIYQITSREYSDYGVVALVEGPPGKGKWIYDSFKEWYKNHPFHEWETLKDAATPARFNSPKYHNEWHSWYTEYTKNDPRPEYPTVRQFCDTFLRNNGFKMLDTAEVLLDYE